jgi:hypothetical protein
MPEAMGPIGALAAVGNAASVSKKTTGVPQDLTSFSVKKGDNGGVIVSETYEKKTPKGRRSSSFVGGMDFKENPFGPEAGAAAASHVTGLLTQMGVAGAESEPEEPSMVAARGPRGNTAARFSGPDIGSEL